MGIIRSLVIAAAVATGLTAGVGTAQAYQPYYQAPGFSFNFGFVDPYAPRFVDPFAQRYAAPPYYYDRPSYYVAPPPPLYFPQPRQFYGGGYYPGHRYDGHRYHDHGGHRWNGYRR